MMPRSNPRRDQGGAVLLVVLIFIFVSTLASASMYEMHQTQVQREKEQELIFVGNQFRRAIASYFNTLPPGGARSLPGSLEDLVNDNRFARPMHHLRRVYSDPMTGKSDWRLLRRGSGLIGVASASERAPIQRHTAGPMEKMFTNAKTYADWTFAIEQDTLK